MAEADLGGGVHGDDRFSVNIGSGPYYRTGHRKSVKNSYEWQLCYCVLVVVRQIVYKQIVGVMRFTNCRVFG